ncbi:MAG: DUF1800 family protein [Planctomycetota bacterium]
MSIPKHRAARIAALALLVSPTLAQVTYTPAELSRAGHILRRTQHGASFFDYPAVLADATNTQIANIITYLTAKLSTTPIPVGPEASNLLGLYNVPTVVGASDPTNPAHVGQAAMNSTPTLRWTINDLVDTNIVRAVWSEDTLREVMTRFWQEHFNTNYWKVRGHFINRFKAPPYSMMPGPAADAATNYAAWFEWQQNDKFRQHATGNFLELLKASAQGASMLIYLDTVGSEYPVANQNYGRELLELHTLGIQSPLPGPGGIAIYYPNYTFQDIQAAAEIFSGWTIADAGTVSAPNFQFSFKPTVCGMPPTGHITPCPLPVPPPNRDLFNSPVVNPLVGPFQVAMDPATESEGLALLQHLADSPATAYHVSKKLYRLFIEDVEPDPFDPLLLNCVTAWGLQPGGDINSVLAVLLGSNTFLNDTTIRWNVERQPIDVVAQAVDVFHGRAYLSDGSAAQDQQCRDRIRRVATLLEVHGGQELFRYPAPDGFPRGDCELLTTYRFIGAAQLRQELYSLFGPFTPTFPSVFMDYLTVLSAGVDFTNETSIRDWFRLIAFNDETSSGDDVHMMWFLTSDLMGLPGPTLLSDFLTNPALAIERVTTSLAFIANHTLNNVK